jgi:hypothetical protein
VADRRRTGSRITKEQSEARSNPGNRKYLDHHNRCAVSR